MKTKALKANVKVATVCWCGCSTFTKGGKFCQGHDAKLKGLLAAVLAGEQPASAIPEVARTHKAEIGFLKGKGNKLNRAFSVKEAK